MMIAQEQPRPHRLDRSFAVLAFFFCCWGLSEYLFPPTGESYDRTVPKLTHVAIMATCLIGTIADFRKSRHHIRFRGTLIFGAVLSVILMFFPIFTYDRMTDQFWPFLLSKFYSGCYTIEWYAVFLYCAVHIQINPRAYQTFLRFVPAMLVIFFLAGHKLTSLNVTALDSPELQGGIYAGYYIACLFPFVWDIENRTIKFIFLLLIIYGVIYSMKRGAILCLFLSLFSSFLTYYLFFAEGTRRISYFFALSLLMAVMVGAVAYSISTKKDTFRHRMEDIASGSGRIDLYQSAWSTFKTLPVDEKITGTRTTSKQIRAHNDFLFVLLCYGIVGLVFYVLFDLSLLILCFQTMRMKFLLLPSLVAALGNIAVIQMVSYGLEGHAFVICCAYVGIVQGFILSDSGFDDEYDILEEEDGEFIEDTDEEYDEFGVEDGGYGENQEGPFFRPRLIRYPEPARVIPFPSGMNHPDRNPHGGRTFG